MECEFGPIVKYNISLAVVLHLRHEITWEFRKTGGV